eukprot:983813-Pelagomonas_calceolata.AAC.11
MASGSPIYTGDLPFNYCASLSVAQYGCRFTLKTGKGQALSKPVGMRTCDMMVHSPMILGQQRGRIVACPRFALCHFMASPLAAQAGRSWRKGVKCVCYWFRVCQDLNYYSCALESIPSTSRKV